MPIVSPEHFIVSPKKGFYAFDKNSWFFFDYEKRQCFLMGQTPFNARLIFDGLYIEHANKGFIIIKMKGESELKVCDLSDITWHELTNDKLPKHRAWMIRDKNEKNKIHMLAENYMVLEFRTPSQL